MLVLYVRMRILMNYFLSTLLTVTMSAVAMNWTAQGMNSPFYGKTNSCFPGFSRYKVGDKEGDFTSIKGLPLKVPQKELKCDFGVSSVTVSPHGEYFFIITSSYKAFLYNENTLISLESIIREGELVYSATFSADGGRLGIGLWNPQQGNIVRVCTLQGDLIKEFQGLPNRVNSLAFSPTGRLILMGLATKNPCLGDSETGKVRSLEGHTNIVCSVAFSPDGRSVLTGSIDRTARLWYAATARPFKLLEGHRGPVTAVAYSTDGAILTASTDRVARLWSSTGICLREFTGHREALRSVAFSPDGSMILTGSDDCTARLWDRCTGKLLAEFVYHNDAVTVARFISDGNAFITGSLDQKICWWSTIKDCHEQGASFDDQSKKEPLSAKDGRSSYVPWIEQIITEDNVFEGDFSDESKFRECYAQNLNGAHALNGHRDLTAQDQADDEDLSLAEAISLALTNHEQEDCSIQ